MTLTGVQVQQPGSEYVQGTTVRAVPEPERALPSDPPPDCFEFTSDDGTVYRSTRPLLVVVTPGLLRRYRSNEMEFAFQVVEQLFSDQPDAMAAIDGSWTCLGRVANSLQPHIEAALRVSLGE